MLLQSQNRVRSRDLGVSLLLVHLLEKEISVAGLKIY
jgi:hypothetical protein